MTATGDTVFILQREMKPDDTYIIGVFTSAGAALAAIGGVVETVRWWEVDRDVFMWYLRTQGTFKYYLLTQIPVSS